MDKPLRRIRFNRWGLAEDPRHLQILANGRLYDVVGVYYRETPQSWMLQTRHFNGEMGPEFAASYVWVLDRKWQP